MNGLWWQCGMSGTSAVSKIDPVKESLESERSVKSIGGIHGLAPAGPGVAVSQFVRGGIKISFIDLEKSKKLWTEDRGLNYYQSAYVVGPWIMAHLKTPDGKSHESVLYDSRHADGRPQSLQHLGHFALPMGPVGKVVLMRPGTVFDPESGEVVSIKNWPSDVYRPMECLPDKALVAHVPPNLFSIRSASDGREIASFDGQQGLHLSSQSRGSMDWKIIAHHGSTLVVRSYATTAHYGLIGYDLAERRVRWKIPHIAVGDTFRSYDPTTLDGDELLFVGTPMPGTVDDRSSESAFVRACRRYAILRVNIETGAMRTIPLQGEFWENQLLRPEGHLCLRGYTATVSTSLDRDVPQQWVMELYRNADGAKISERWFKGVAAACVWRDQVVVVNGNRLEILARQDAPV